ncbi:E3 ubiquitin-protein ligase RING1-like [Syzygium oleosum]|uniref:E3 ubiquitin-protein ligase RING1-like n=1 Tax=Syzygium oleosum TaxID=219896 RepID=UPI0011D281BC|nr:E3 ubiquitin-protein ligase RING1-like [Syzygium oleosum]
MSFTSRGDFAAPGGDPGRKWFFCHRCSETVAIAVSPSAEPLCPRCHEGFLEECENPSPPRSRSPPFFPDPFSSFLPLLFPTSAATHTTATAAPAATFDLQNPGLFSIPSSSPSGGSENLFDPFAFLMNHLQDLQSSGAQIQFVVENSPSEGRGGGGFRLPANIDDYFMGPGLEQLIQQLAENDPNRHGTPPASKSAVENLPTIKVTEELQNSEMNQCAVCQDDFEKDMEVKQMPCKHIYHADCLLPWLELHNSCPVCRHELPTDDPNYENRRDAAQGNAQGGSSGTSSGRGENRSFQRSFSITLPFRGNDGSNSGSGGE